MLPLHLALTSLQTFKILHYISAPAERGACDREHRFCPQVLVVHGRALWRAMSLSKQHGKFHFIIQY